MWRALLDFRARHGRYWKRALLAKWMNGSDELEPFSSSLRMLRPVRAELALCPETGNTRRSRPPHRAA
jgi:hypothetical protein